MRPEEQRPFGMAVMDWSWEKRHVVGSGTVLGMAKGRTGSDTRVSVLLAIKSIMSAHLGCGEAD